MGDAVMPVIGIGMSMAIVKIRARMASRKTKNQVEPKDQEGVEERDAELPPPTDSITTSEQ